VFCDGVSLIDCGDGGVRGKTYGAHEHEEVGEVRDYGAEVGLCYALGCCVPLFCFVFVSMLVPE
jgi:hypothetical protein